MLLVLSYVPHRQAGLRKRSLQAHSSCSLPRKSLVKGESFIRAEGKKELLPSSDTGLFILQNVAKLGALLIY